MRLAVKNPPGLVVAVVVAAQLHPEGGNAASPEILLPRAQNKLIEEIDAKTQNKSSLNRSS
jgi:hypothetical protein